MELRARDRSGPWRRSTHASLATGAFLSDASSVTKGHPRTFARVTPPSASLRRWTSAQWGALLADSANFAAIRRARTIGVEGGGGGEIRAMRRPAASGACHPRREIPSSSRGNARQLNGLALCRRATAADTVPISWLSAKHRQPWLVAHSAPGLRRTAPVVLVVAKSAVDAVIRY